MNVQTSLQGPTSREIFQTLDLTITPFVGHEFHVTSLRGREAISEPYRFEVDFTCVEPLRLESAIGQSARLSLTTGGERLTAAGVVIAIDADDPTLLGDFAYRVVIGPRFELLRLSQPNQIYGTERSLDLPTLIRGKLDNTLSQSSTSSGSELQVSCDLRLVGDYPQRDHIAQINETDFDFLSRLCEHHGVFYFFEHQSDGETMVFGDSNQAFNPSEADSLPFRITRGQADDASVASFKATARPVSRTYFVRDYDDMQATVPLLASRSVDPRGFGAIVDYGCNFVDQRWGAHLAQVRAEAQLAQRLIFNGISTAPGLRPGAFFRLKGHPHAGLDGQYVVTAVSHTAGQHASATGPYENSFEAIPFDTTFRPQRRTPRPDNFGLFDAVIDSASDGVRADIDSHGRYRVRMIFDETSSPAGQASMYVRQAVPYAGKSDTGFHMPLLKGTRVLIGFVNGNPDRPVIVGAVPNSDTPSVVTQGNHVVNRLRTPSGGLFEIHDGTQT